MKPSQQIKIWKNHLEFMQYFWKKKAEPLRVGRHTKAICERIDKAIYDFDNGISTYLLITVPYRHGKALEINTPIPTPDGWKKMGELKVGDYVYGSDGKPVRIIQKSPVWENRRLVEVSIDNGRDIIYSDEEHLWVCKKDRRQLTYKTYTAKELCNKSRSLRQIFLNKPLNNKEKELLIDPYILGLWLGDGSSYGGRFTAHPEDIEFYKPFFEKAGFELSKYSSGYEWGVLGLHEKLRELNLLKNKHIPIDYLRASYNQRLELLRGLIDTDGDVSKNRNRISKNPELTGGQVTFVNKNKQLANDVVELVRSLGVKCSITDFETKLYGKSCGTGYKVSFYMKDCCKLQRKKERTRDSQKITHHSARFTLTEKYGDTVCIQVENSDGVFLCGKSMTPTHNSDIVSRYLPAHFIGAHPDCDVMLVTYASSLAQEFSAFSRDIASSSEFKEVFGNNYRSGSSDSWMTTKGSGIVTASGLTSGITGKGYHLGILDDYCSGRAEAESPSQREKMWQGFTNDFFTRQAPVSITIILATPWHVDDIIGRIKAKNDKDNEKYDESFQKFEVISFPAMNGEIENKDENGNIVIEKYDYLFPERFGEEWYKRQESSLGSYGAASLLQCNPQVRGGNLVDTGKVKIINNINEFPLIKYYRVWDLAHSQKQRLSDDPDWTSGTLLAFQKCEGGIYKLWIKDVARIRAKAPERDNFIRSVAEKDGQSVTICVESSVESKDTLATMQSIFNGRRVVKGVPIRGDKVARFSPIEPIFEAGNVYIMRGEWNLDWLNEVREFPSGKHDDQVDNMSAGFIICSQGTGEIKRVGVAGV